tara:strand:+ start:114 stop:431 length:318 start_codon:yes stop_codon:yes gene_type:complete
MFVRHPKRGWEIPGGHLNDGETPEEAMIRELFEETGCNGEIVAWNKAYYDLGWVAHVVVESVPSHDPWSVEDGNVAEVKWWSEIPPVIEWTKEEFSDLSKWCANL